MKRIAAVLSLWVIVLGGLNLYMNRLEARKSVLAPVPSQAESSADYALEITTTFNVEPDPFALRTDNSSKPAALLVRIGEKVLADISEAEAGIPVRIAPVPGMLAGVNEFFVEANMPLEMTGRNLALRLRLLRDGLPAAEKTFWSEGENRIAGTFRVNPGKDPEVSEPRHE